MSNTTSEIESLLSQHQLRNTEKRRDILRLFLTNDFALSSKMIEESLKNHIDRVTLYRLLHSFEDKGLIHRVINKDNETFYARCTSCHSQHTDEHLHFHCTSCNKVTCIKHITTSSIIVPEGFEAKTINLDIYGICKKCNND